MVQLITRLSDDTAQSSGIVGCASLQPFSQKSRTPTVAKEFRIGLYDPAEADLELFCNSWSVGFLGERLYLPTAALVVLSQKKIPLHITNKVMCAS